MPDRDPTNLKNSSEISCFFKIFCLLTAFHCIFSFFLLGSRGTILNFWSHQNFEILAVISYDYLRLTTAVTAHTQVRLLLFNIFTTHLHLKVGDGFDLYIGYMKQYNRGDMSYLLLSYQKFSSVCWCMAKVLKPPKLLYTVDIFQQYRIV